MLIHLSEVSTSVGKTSQLNIPYSKNVFSSRLGEFPIVEKGDAIFVFTCLEKGKVKIDGSFSMKAVAPCDRCLCDVSVPVSVSFSVEIDTAEGEELDTDKLLYNEILMKWPMKVLCKEDCKGICKKCGQNLNKGACNCDTIELDPRMAAIKDIFEKHKEV